MRAGAPDARAVSLVGFLPLARPMPIPPTQSSGQTCTCHRGQGLFAVKVMPTAFYLGQLVDVRGHGRAEVIDVGADLAPGTQFHGRIKGKYPAHAAASPSHAAAAAAYVQQNMVRGGNCQGTGVLSPRTAVGAAVAWTRAVRYIEDDTVFWANPAKLRPMKPVSQGPFQYGEC